MAFQPVDNTAQFTAKFTVLGEPCQFAVYSNDDAGNWDATELNDVMEAIRDAIVTEYMPAVSEDHAYLGIVGRDLEAEFGRVEELFEPAPVAGGLDEPSLPGNTVVRATFMSATGAPRRGGISLLAPTEAQVTGNRLLAGAQTALQAAVEAISAAAGLAARSHVIVSRFDGRELVTVSKFGEDTTVWKPKKRASGVVADVARVRIGTRIDTLRRRLPAE